jgi:phosphate-selective porin OprO/OprP
MQPIKSALCGLLITLTILFQPVLFADDNSSFDIDIDLALIYDWHSYRGEIFDNISSDNIFDLRKLKLSFDVDLLENLDFKLSFDHDTEENKPQTDDAYLRYKFSKQLRVQLGQFKEPFGLEYMQSFSNQYTMERSIATNSLTFGRNRGIKLAYLEDYWTLQSSITEEQPDDDTEADLAFTLRATTALMLPQNDFIHFGLSHTMREADVTSYDIDEQLIARPVGNLIHSPNMDYSKLTASGIELAGRYGPVILQAERFEHYLNDINDDGHVYSGYYLTGMWTIMGNKRDYKKGRIVFDGSSTHTIELALRKSYLDLELEGEGDRADTVTAALNYYYKENFRTSLELQHAVLKTYDDNEIETESGNSLAVRMQYAF